MRWRRRPRHWLQERVNSDPEYRKAVEFAQTHVPTEGCDYSWVVDHANEQFRQMEEGIAALDDKASKIITYVGAFAGVSAVTFAYQAATVHWVIGASFLPTLVLALMAISQAVQAVSPCPQPFPPSAERARAYAEAYPKEAAQARFALQTWAAFEGARVVSDVKSELIQRAHALFNWAAWLLLAPAVAAVIFRLLLPGIGE
jgi:hypothetical protein